MTPTPKHNQRIANMTFSSVYPHYVAKVKNKGRTLKELHQVITWLTGYDDDKIESLIKEKVNFESFFTTADLHPHADQIKGVICGYRIEKIDNDLTRQVRYLDKMVDELARGRALEKILR